MTLPSLSRMIFDHVGSPMQPNVEAHVGACWYCGGRSGRGLAVGRWAGEGFNAYARAQRRSDPTATHVCEACVFVCSRLSPVPGRPPKPGKKLGGNFRNYSHAAEQHGEAIRYVNATKSETAALVDFLRDAGSRGPWAMAVATSGQKHVIPHAPTNMPGQRAAQIAFEELVVHVDLDRLLGLVVVCNTLRRASGCGVDAIVTGIYHPMDLQRALMPVRAFEREHARLRGSGILELAAFLASTPAKARP